MDSKNVIAAISLSAAVIIIYSLFFGPSQEEIKQKQINFEEGELTVEQLRTATEIFTTNSMTGVQGIGEFEGKSMTLSFAKELQYYLDSVLQ